MVGHYFAGGAAAGLRRRASSGSAQHYTGQQVLYMESTPNKFHSATFVFATIMDVTIESVQKSLKYFQGGNISKGVESLKKANFCLTATSTGIIAAKKEVILKKSRDPLKNEDIPVQSSGEETAMKIVDVVEEDDEASAKLKRRSGVRLTRGGDGNHQTPPKHAPSHSALSSLLGDSPSSSSSLSPSSSSARLTSPNVSASAPLSVTAQEIQLVSAIHDLIKYISDASSNSGAQLFPFRINGALVQQHQIISFLEVCFDQLINNERVTDRRLQCFLSELVGDVFAQIGHYTESFQYYIFCVETLEYLSLTTKSDEQALNETHPLPWEQISTRLQVVLHKLDCLDVLYYLTLFNCDQQQDESFLENQLYRFQRNRQVMEHFLTEMEGFGDFLSLLECDYQRSVDNESISSNSSEKKGMYCFEQVVKILSRPNNGFSDKLRGEIQTRILEKIDGNLDLMTKDMVISKRYQPLRDKYNKLVEFYKLRCSNGPHNSILSLDILEEEKTINQQWTNDVMVLLRDVMAMIESRIGPTPFDLKYCVLLLGSYGREEACICSDLDIAVVYSNESQDESFNHLVSQYFSVFFKLFSMAISWITRDCMLLKPSQNHFDVPDATELSSKGLKLDYCHNPVGSTSLIFEVHTLLQKLKPAANSTDMASMTLPSLFHSSLRLKGDAFFYEEFLYQLPLLCIDEEERLRSYCNSVETIMEDFAAKSLLLQQQMQSFLAVPSGHTLSTSTSVGLSDEATRSTTVADAKLEYLFIFTLIDLLCQRYQIIHNPNSRSQGGGSLIERLRILQDKELIHISLSEGLQIIVRFLLRLRYELHNFYGDGYSVFVSYNSSLSYEQQFDTVSHDFKGLFVLQPEDNRLWSHYRSYLHTLLLNVHSNITASLHRGDDFAHQDNNKESRIHVDNLADLHPLDLRVVARFWLLRIDCEMEKLFASADVDAEGDTDAIKMQLLSSSTLQRYFNRAQICRSKLTEGVALTEYIEKYVSSKVSSVMMI